MQDASALGNAYCDLKWETYTEPKERPPLTANQPHSTSLTDAHLATVFSIDFFLLKQITHSLKENITGHMCPGDPTRTVSRNPNSRRRIKYILCNFKSGWMFTMCLVISEPNWLKEYWKIKNRHLPPVHCLPVGGNCPASERNPSCATLQNRGWN